jgi:hypothetical protein
MIVTKGGRRRQPPRIFSGREINYRRNYRTSPTPEMANPLGVPSGS